MLTDKQKERFYNSPIVCAVMQGLCSNAGLYNRNYGAEHNSKSIVNHFEHVVAQLHLSIEGTIHEDETPVS